MAIDSGVAEVEDQGEVLDNIALDDGVVDDEEGVRDVDEVVRRRGCRWKKKRKAKPAVVAVPFLRLFKFATGCERVLISLGVLSGALHGATIPLSTILFGDLMQSFGQMNGMEVNMTDVLDQIRFSSLRLVYLGIAAFVTGVLMVWLLMRTSQWQGRRVRNLYLRALLSQEVAWYDEVDSAELAQRVSTDVQKFEDGIGDKVSTCFQFISMFITGFVIGFVYGWQLTLVVLAVAPLLVASGAFFAKMSTDAVSEGQTSYAKAGAVAEETFSMIRIVASYNLEEVFTSKYIAALKDSLRAGVRKAIWFGVGLGLTMFIIFCAYGLAFWYGNLRVGKGMKGGDVATVFFSVLLGAIALGQAAPAVNAINEAKGAAPKIFEVISRQSQIDAFSTTGLICDHVDGSMQLTNVNFTYKSRPDRLVLADLNLTIEAGTTVALVGESGCGKSTAVQLLERFYDPIFGTVTLDGIDLKDYNVQWLRDQIGFVAQMPSLFALSIRDNIVLGAGLRITKTPGGDGTRKFEKKQVSFDEVVAAAKLANAHDFISALPQGYDTIIGSRGAQLSGGQKQRVAIARALIRDPKILLLDEATSALDTASERVVQEAIERAQKGRTTVVIAHRLSTIRHADKIAVFEAGSIAEIGTHEELMAINNGIYQNLVNLQHIVGEKEKEALAERKKAISVEIPPLLQYDTKSKKSSRKGGKVVLKDKADEQRHEKDWEETAPAIDRGVVCRAYRLNGPEWPYLALGLVGAVGNGCIWPAFALIFSEIVVVLVNPESTASDVNRWVLYFVAIGTICWLFNSLQLGMTGIAGEKLTNRLRILSFKALVRQNVGFFDMRQNSVGLLTSRLANESSKVKNITGERVSILVCLIATLIFAIIFSFSFCWRLAFVVLATLPLIAAGGVIQMRMMAGLSGELNKLFHQANSLSIECVDSIQTVIALGAGETFLHEYDQELELPCSAGKKKAVIASLAFAFTEFALFAIWALAFWYGGQLGEQNICNFAEVMKALMALVFGAMNTGQVSAYLPDAAEARVAATRIFRILDRRSEIDPLSESGDKVTVVGKASYDNVYFRYPAREEVTVLKGLTEVAEPGKTLALVGPSGSGKSTLAMLIERFYDSQQGSVLIDDRDLRGLNLASYRSHVGFVAQEPELFSTTIRENIAHGFAKHNATVVTEEQIVSAAKLANAHDFIVDLPKGYDTEVGPHGRELSGGERQRVAIARAIVRNPKVLVLDEATSALDSESEKVVQEALNNASVGRTTIIIAHRLSTIQRAHMIAVVVDGRIYERGKHEDLVAKPDGAYAKLVQQQAL